MNKTSRILIYILYALAASLFFLYMLFPSDIFKEILMERLAQTQSEIDIHIDTIRPTIPPGLNIQPVSVSLAGKPFLRSEKVNIRPRLLSLIGGSKTISFHGPLGNGHFRGRANLANTNKRSQEMVNVDLSEVPLNAIAYFKQWSGFAPNGSMDGKLVYNIHQGGTGRMDANVVIAPFRITINPPMMGLDVLDFTELQAEISATRKQLTIKQCEAFGPQIEGKVTGFIALRQPMGSSRLTLSITVKPQPAFIADHKDDIIGGLLSSSKAQKRGVVFRLSGTLDNPNYVIR